jgi:hypothetical protein
MYLYYDILYIPGSGFWRIYGMQINLTQPQVPTVYVAAWAPGLVWMLWSTKKSLAPAGNQTPVRPVACQYTDWAIPATH